MSAPETLRERITAELEAIAFSDLTDYVRVEDGQVVIPDSRSLSPAHRAALQSIKDSGKGVEIKLHDKQKALELLAKLLGVFDERQTPEPIRVELELPPEWAE